MKFQIAAIGMMLSCSSAFATAPLAPTEKRLIQTSPTERSWRTYSEIADLSNKAHEAGHCGGFMDVTDFQNKILAPQPFTPFTDLAVFPTPSHASTVEPLLKQVDAAKLTASVTQLASYNNRFYKEKTGVDAANWIAGEFKRLAGSRSDIQVELFKHSKFPQPSVIARIQGSGPQANEKVIIGAHLDSIFWGGGWPVPAARAPGADDDASGIATLFEAFRVISASGFRPNRTLEFIGYAGEEMGLLGSQDIAQAYKRAKTQVAGVLQFDMTMYNTDAKAMNLIADYTHRGLTQFTEQLIDRYVGMPWGETKCDYACSDHASWNEAGYAAAFPFESTFEGANPKIHTSGDTIDNQLDSAFGLGFAKLAVAFAVELSAPAN